VFLLGFSQGAIIGASVALTRPDLVAGLVMMSGRILPEIKDLIASNTALEQLPVLVTHGLQDSKLPIHHARASREKLVQLGVKLTYTEYDMAHEMIAPEIQEISTWLTARLDD
jgi:phospholipase/carboxylesterase